jgi:DNA topoisomerase-1
VPTWTAFAVSQLLESHLPDLVDYQFTAAMEDELDAISRGELDYVEYLRHFYFGKDEKGLKDLVATKSGEIDARTVCRVRLGQPEGQPEVFVRVGRYGPFLEQGDRRASIPEQMPPDELTLEAALAMLETSTQSEEPLGHNPEGKPIYLKVGRFGPYLQCGSPDDEEKPQNRSLPKGMNPEDVTLDLALKILSLPRTLGTHPESGQPIMAFDGKFGPYIRCGDEESKETRSLPAGVSPLDVTLQQALELLAQPKAQGRGRGGAKREPLKVFEASPVTGNPVQLLSGRYGAYVTDGTTNATLPRGTAPEELTLEYALNLLKVRAEQGPSERQLKKAAAKKAAATRKAAPKKAVKKKAAKKAVKKAE